MFALVQSCHATLCTIEWGLLNQLRSHEQPRIGLAAAPQLLVNLPGVYRFATDEERRELASIVFAQVWVADNAIAAITPH